jgi:hypothetical protein
MSLYENNYNSYWTAGVTLLSGKGHVPYLGIGHCLGPEGNGVSLEEGRMEGRAPQTRSKITSLAPARKEATWSRRKKEGRARRDNEDPACTE